MVSPDSTSAVIPTQPETAGMPRLRARMATWLVPPPASVTMPAMASEPRLIAWLGRISWATRMTGESPSCWGPSPSPPGRPAPAAPARLRCEPMREITSRTSAIRSRKKSCSWRAKVAAYPWSTIWRADSAVSPWVWTRSRTLASIDSSLTIWRWDLKISASAAPSCSATFRTIDSSSAADVATARSNRSISGATISGPSRASGDRRAEHRVDPIGDPHHHTRADRDSLVHKTHSLARTGQSTQIGFASARCSRKRRSDA